ncbi:hypothetical protein ACNKHW_19885 [Shigella flexneri]
MQAIPVESASIVSLQDEKHVGFQSMVEEILQVAERHLRNPINVSEKPVRLQNRLSACSAVAAMPFRRTQTRRLVMLLDPLVRCANGDVLRSHGSA